MGAAQPGSVIGPIPVGGGDFVFNGATDEFAGDKRGDGAGQQYKFGIIRQPRFLVHVVGEQRNRDPEVVLRGIVKGDGNGGLLSVLPFGDLRARLLCPQGQREQQAGQRLAAAQRGVDVRILTPDGQTDVPLVRWAARAHYGELLAGGVRIWEYRPAMMHAKTFVVDGVWVGIGSMNFDNRSLAVNDESTLLVADTALGAAMERAFLDDLGRATELTRETFPRRGRWERVKERFAVLASRLL